MIDDILWATFGGYAPSLWLVTGNYEDAPEKQPGTRNDGTRPPIPENFESPWIRKQLDELAKWLKAKPSETDLNDRHFAVLDKGAKANPPTIVVCRIDDHNAEGDKLFLLRKGRIEAVEHLIGAPPDVWDEWVRYKGNAEIEYDDDDA
jgi:hypothetical protein